MNQIFQKLIVISVVTLILMTSTPAFAGPGGTIVSAAFQTFLGKIVLSFLVVIFFPLILYTILREYLAQRRTLKDLRKLATIDKLFDWLTLRDRITDCFYQVHTAWRKEKMVEAGKWMTDWYYRNQQIVYIDQWARDGLSNHCRVRKISAIRPLFLACRSNDKREHEGSKLVVSIAADIEDYLVERDSGKVVEGRKGFKEVETVWTFTIRNGKWVVANIEEDTLSLTYAQLANELPGYLDQYEVSQGKVF